MTQIFSLIILAILFILPITSKSQSPTEYEQPLPSQTPSSNGQSANQSIHGTTAGGGSQTTIIDENGNLKMIESKETGQEEKSSPSQTTSDMAETAPAEVSKQAPMPSNQPLPRPDMTAAPHPSEAVPANPSAAPNQPLVKPNPTPPHSAIAPSDGAANPSPINPELPANNNSAVTAPNSMSITPHLANPPAATPPNAAAPSPSTSQ